MRSSRPPSRHGSLYERLKDHPQPRKILSLCCADGLTPVIVMVVVVEMGPTASVCSADGPFLAVSSLESSRFARLKRRHRMPSVYSSTSFSFRPFSVSTLAAFCADLETTSSFHTAACKRRHFWSAKLSTRGVRVWPFSELSPAAWSASAICSERSFATPAISRWVNEEPPVFFVSTVRTFPLTLSPGLPCAQCVHRARGSAFAFLRAHAAQHDNSGE